MASGHVCDAFRSAEGRPMRPRLLSQWWAHLVGALQVHPHKHYANYPPQKDRGCARGERDRRRQSCGGPMAITMETCYVTPVAMTKDRSEVLQGTLDLMVLK